ncbi:MAG: phenylacetate--CoA ligase family protein [Verrucomicrobiota bacterium]
MSHQRQPEDAAALEAIRSLLGAVLPTNPFYGRKYASVGCSALPASLDDFRTRFLLTTKSELVADQSAFPPYGSNLTFPLTAYTRCHQTSGTHGAPLRWLDTPESWSAMTDAWVEVLRQAGVGPGDRAFFPFSFGPFLGFWLAFEAAQRLGVLSLSGGGMSSILRLRVLLEQGFTVMCCTPTYALHLAETARAEGIDLRRSRVRRILVAGEPGGSQPTVRARIESAWPGARVFDHHGMTETGPVTFESPELPGSLVLLDAQFHAEILDPQTLAPVPEGSRGELVLTTLKRIGSPLIRYRTGDWVLPRRWRGTWAFEGGILGRVDDMVVVRGVNLYPSAVEAVVRSLDAVGEYRVTIDRSGDLAAVSIEAEASEETCRELAERLHGALSLRMAVTSVPTGSLPRFELKAKRWRFVPPSA